MHLFSFFCFFEIRNLSQGKFIGFGQSDFPEINLGEKLKSSQCKQWCDNYSINL